MTAQDKLQEAVAAIRAIDDLKAEHWKERFPDFFAAIAKLRTDKNPEEVLNASMRELQLRTAETLIESENKLKLAARAVIECWENKGIGIEAAFGEMKDCL